MSSGSKPNSAEGLSNLKSRLALRPQEAAKALGVSERSLRAALHSLPHLRLGSVVLLPVDALRSWLEEQVRAEGARNDSAVDDVLKVLGLEK